MEKALANRQAIITGGSQGLGLEIAKKFVDGGAEVMICGRNKSLLESAQAQLLSIAAPNQKVVISVADVSNPIDVERLTSETISKLGKCQILVNNAGIYGPKGNIESIDWNDWLKTMEININGSVLMSRAMLPHFKANGYGKIIQLSGGGATNPLPHLSAYAVSKAAIVRFSETLAEEVRGLGIDVNAIAPGALNTGMLDEILSAGPAKVGREFYEKSLNQKKSGGAPLSRGAELAVFLASSKSDGITAKLISAIWDNWEDWADNIDALDSSDAYTLRRIVGGDRGITWGDK
ncbi:SDR family oxidoreductase [Pseudomonadales bacterium]|nr:SDR family oxidoreductase [Pseudomonadales bacterium]